MATLPKISIGRKSKKAYFDWSHDVNTTMDFGFCQPTLIDCLMPGSNVKLTTKQFVRLAPLPTPTFGRVKVHTDTQFVPMKSVFPAVENFFSQTAVNSRTSYVPEDMDQISNGDMLFFLIAMSNYYGMLGQYDKCPLRYSFFARCSLDSSEENDTSRNFPYRDILNDPDIVNNPAKQATAYFIVQEYFCPNGNVGAGTDFWSQVQNNQYTGLSSGNNPALFNLVTGAKAVTSKNYPTILNFITNVGERNWYTKVGANGSFPPSYNAIFGRLNQYAGASVTSTCLDGIQFGRDEVNTPISLQGCDYYFDIANNKLPAYYLCDNDGAKTTTQGHFLGKGYFCMRLTRFGRRLLRIFRTARMDFFGRFGKPKPLAPLFAYYKAWFDLYNPGRTLNWENTNAFRLIHLYYDYGEIFHKWCLVVDGSAQDVYDFSVDSFRKVFVDFLIDLGKCCYVLPIDNVTVATQEIEENLRTDIDDVDVYYDATAPSSKANLDVHDYSPYGTDGIVNDAGGLGIKLLERAYYWTNENTVIGQKVRELCAKYNISPKRESVISRDSYMCNISDVFSTAETSEGYLGEYAGKGIGSGQQSFSLQDTKEYGYIIQFVSIAPHAGYVQGEGVFPLRRLEFYNAQFDSLGKEPIPYSDVFNTEYDIDNRVSNSVFGFAPRYFGLKVRNNIANGYFAERSNQAAILPYSLDRLFRPQDQRISADGKQTENIYGYMLYAGEDLRFVGLDESLGLYDRIFHASDGLVDNFIMHIIQDYKAWCPMKPVSQSFDTFDPEVDDNSFDVEHA